MIIANRKIAGMSQRLRIELSSAISMPAAIAVSTGMATREVASGLMIARGRKARAPRGGCSSVIAASFGGEFHQVIYASLRRCMASNETT